MIEFMEPPEIPKVTIEFLRLLREESERMSFLGLLLPSGQPVFTQRSNTMAKGKLFTYAVLFHPKPTKDTAGNDTTPKSELLIKPTDCLAATADQVRMIATRQIPKEYEDRLDLVEVIVRPFN
jgi:hypothetical protein